MSSPDLRMRTLRHKLTPPRREKLAAPTKRAAPFYSSPEWVSLMREIKAERGDRCEDPEHNPARPRAGGRIFGDHIQELKDGGAPLDKANILLRCGSCHTRKTAAARGLRLHARPADQGRGG
ncbi:MAG: HNH endonuclease [Acetobacteraceae bacterium]